MREAGLAPLAVRSAYPVPANPPPQSRPARRRLYVRMPEVLSLKENRYDTIEIYRSIRRAVRKRHALHLDFTTLRRVTPAAALVLASEIDRWRRIRNFRPIVMDIERWDPGIAQLLLEMGLFDLVDAKNPPAFDPTAQSTQRFIRFRSGSGARGDEAIALRERLEGVTGESAVPQSRRALFRGVTEAMTNVHKHAYHGPFEDHTPILPDEWWIGGGYDIARKSLRALVFDQGVGIPNTLPRRFPLQSIVDFIKRRGWTDRDSTRIAAAMDLGATRTGNPYQGRGLPDLRRLANSARQARLRILSRCGEYIYCAGQPEQLVDYETLLGGTLIQWEIDL
ncbi:MAG: hypothetical protein ACREEL_00125 [Stellaceae bacterium]